MNFIKVYDQEARPFEWTYAGNPLADGLSQLN
jgi:hypothetical protein